MISLSKPSFKPKELFDFIFLSNIFAWWWFPAHHRDRLVSIYCILLPMQCSLVLKWCYPIEKPLFLLRVGFELRTVSIWRRHTNQISHRALGAQHSKTWLNKIQEAWNHIDTKLEKTKITSYPLRKLFGFDQQKRWGGWLCFILIFENKNIFNVRIR